MKFSARAYNPSTLLLRPPSDQVPRIRRSTMISEQPPQRAVNARESDVASRQGQSTRRAMRALGARSDTSGTVPKPPWETVAASLNRNRYGPNRQPFSNCISPRHVRLSLSPLFVHLAVDVAATAPSPMDQQHTATSPDDVSWRHLTLTHQWRHADVITKKRQNCKRTILSQKRLFFPFLRISLLFSLHDRLRPELCQPAQLTKATSTASTLHAYTTSVRELPGIFRFLSSIRLQLKIKLLIGLEKR